MALRNLRGSVGGRDLVDRLSAHVHGAQDPTGAFHGLHQVPRGDSVYATPCAITHHHRGTALHTRELHLETLHLRGVLLGVEVPGDELRPVEERVDPVLLAERGNKLGEPATETFVELQKLGAGPAHDECFSVRHECAQVHARG